MKRPTVSLDTLFERFDILDGTRGSDSSRRAVRVGDMTPTMEFPAAKSKKASAAVPTAAEFDALVDDVHTIFTQLRAQAEALRTRKNQ